MVVASAAAAAETRGLTIKLRASEARNAPVAEEVRLYGASYALVIGIDTYTGGGWPRLSNAVKDAELVATELRKRGFDVTFETDLKSAELKSAFEEFFILKGTDPTARLFVWFAGHGHTIEDEGYLVPADAPSPETNKALFKLKALNMRRFGEYVREAESKHAFAVFDACFAGTIFSTQRSRPPPAIAHATTMPVRQFLTSGDANQKVSDDGKFRKLFLRALRGEEKRADANGDGYVTATEIGLFLQDRVTNLTRTRQTPRYGKLNDEDYDLGDFVFAMPRGAVAAAPVQPTLQPAMPTMSDASVAWQSIQNSTNPEEIEAFILAFRDSPFTGIARAKLKVLKQQQVAAVVAPTPTRPPERPSKSVRPAVLRVSPSVLKSPFEATRTWPPARPGGTLRSVRSKGFVQCGVSQGLPGFSNPDWKERWTGIDVDVCRAIAAAVVGDADKVRYTPLTAKERFTSLQSGEIDVLSRNTTWTLLRDTALGLDFAGVTYYDGQGFMVREALGVKSAKELDGASVCIQTGTTTELNLANFFRSNNMRYKPVVFERGNEVFAAYDAGRCDVFTTDQTYLAAQRTRLKTPGAHMILPEIISKEPLGPVVRHGDDQWADIVRWSLRAMFAAEQYGVSSANVDRMRASTTNPDARRLLGGTGDIGPRLGLDRDWAYRIVRQVGNYGEIFARNLGSNTPMGLSRGLNALWSKGGLMYSPPVR